MEAINSIFLSVAEKIGGIQSGADFQTDLIDTINACFAYCHQYGCGPEEGFFIQDETATWDDFVCKSLIQKHFAKEYVFLKTKKLFDPPQSGPLMQALEKEIAQTEWFITNCRQGGNLYG